MPPLERGWQGVALTGDCRQSSACCDRQLLFKGARDIPKKEDTTLNSHQKLGILGGMGPQATLDFYQQVLNHTAADTDQQNIETVILSDTQMPDRTAAILSGDHEEILARLYRDAKQLEDLGCSAIAVPCNTSHYFLPTVQRDISIPIIHMIDETAKYLAEQGRTRPAILATDGTLKTALYQTACEKFGLTAVVPTGDVQRQVMSIIYDEIKAGRHGVDEEFVPIHQWVEESGCDCAILACTELSTFAIYHPLPPLYVDAMDILARRAVEICGGTLK